MDFIEIWYTTEVYDEAWYHEEKACKFVQFHISDTEPNENLFQNDDFDILTAHTNEKSSI